MFRRRNLPSNARTSRARSIYARECDAAFPFATSRIKARIKILFSSSAQKSSFLPSWLKNETIGIVRKRAIGVRNRRRGYPREPKETKIITHSRTLEVIFAEATVEVVKENILYSCRCVCVCVDMISNEVIFDLAAAFVKRAKTREKRGVHTASKKYTEENLGWRGWIEYCSSLSRSSSSPFTDL